jgi:hypothetical protein
VFVFGADHSGTTILYRMLAYHPRLVWFSQFSLRGGQIPGRSRRPGAHLLEPLLHSTIRRFIPHPWEKAELGQLRRLVVPRPGEEGQIWDHLLGSEEVDVVRLRECLTSVSDRLGRRRLLAKRPIFWRYLDLLRSAFPEARFVHVVRDGRPVALSLRAKRLSAAARGRDLDADGGLRASARYWVDVLDRVAATPDIDLLEVRYEDLCADVRGTIGSILRHAGLDDGSFPHARCPHALENQSPRWLEAATHAELCEISEIQRPLLRRYGYPPEPAAAG